MSATPQFKHRWETRESGCLTAASWHDGALTVRFEDGTRVRVDAARLVPARIQEPNWSAMTFNAHELVVPTPQGDHEIPWDVIRAITDPDFAAFFAAEAAADAHLIGRRV